MKQDRDVAELIALMKQHRVLHMKLGGLELTLHPSAFESGGSADIPNEPELTREQLLLWSTPHQDESEAQS